MRKHIKKMLALFLAFLLAGFSSGFSPQQVFAQTTDKPKEPAVVEKTTTSITLKTENDLEYAIQTEKSDANGEAEQTSQETDGAKNMVWTWAKEEQYNRDSQTVIFQELKAGTTYNFTYRQKGSTTKEEELPVFTFSTTAEKENIPEDAGKKPADNPPKEEISAPVDTKPQDTDPATQDTKPQDADPTPQDTKPQNTDSVPQDTKPLDADPAPQDTKPQDTVSVPTAPKPLDESGNNSSSATTEEPPKSTDSSDTQAPKDPKPAPQPLTPPDVPKVKEFTDTKIQLVTVENHEYAMILDGPELNWQTSGTFENLKPSTDYSFVARVSKENQTSDPSKALKVRTKASAAKAPAVPELKSKTDVMIQVTPVSGQEYSLLENNVPTKWNSSGTFDNLSPGTEYKIVTRVSYKDEEAMPSEISSPLTVKTKLAAAKAPAAPGFSGRSQTSITLKAQDSLEYAISTDGASWKWQNSNTFNNLSANTSYQFIAREKFDPDQAIPSKESSIATFKTYIAFDGKIDGITPNGTYYRDTKLTASAIGTGMNQTSPGTWDSRWIPKNWSWNEKDFRTWDAAPYDVTFVLDKIGDYKLTVGYELQEYTSGSWKGTGQTKSISVSFKAVVPVYTIKASSDKYGKISPSGTIEVKEGTNTEFTFTPNKEYKISKVLVDGKEVTVKDNKYTISDIKANHTISVSFERINGREIPKTGDENPLIVYFILLIAAGVILLFAAKKHLNKTRR